MKKKSNLHSAQLSETTSKYRPFLLEARKRLIFTLCVFVIATITGFILHERIIKFLISLLSLEGINIVFTSPFQFVNLAISCGVVTGLIVVFPLLISQIIFFLKPALRTREYRLIVMLLPFSFLLFLIGFAFGGWIMRWQIQMFLSKSVTLGIGNVLDISQLISTVLLTSAFMGLGFQFPIILLLLLHLGLLKRHQLSKQRPLVYLGALIFAILLPVDSILADILLALPFVILFEFTLLLNLVFKNNK